MSGGETQVDSDRGAEWGGKTTTSALCFSSALRERTLRSAFHVRAAQSQAVTCLILKRKGKREAGRLNSLHAPQNYINGKLTPDIGVILVLGGLCLREPPHEVCEHPTVHVSLPLCYIIVLK